MTRIKKLTTASIRDPYKGSMAEGGKDEDENNPFSFKSFISKKDKKKDDSSNSKDEDVDIFDISDNASQKRKEKTRPSLLVADGTSIGFFEKPWVNLFAFKSVICKSSACDVSLTYLEAVCKFW